MIDEELKRYIESLLKQGYDLKSIRESLIKAGHDIAKVEDISLKVFELFHSQLIKYIDARISEGHSMEDIKKELVKLGHSEKKLIDIINYHKSKKPRIYFNAIYEVLHSEKLWVKHYTVAYLIIFLIIIISLVILSVIVSKNSEPDTLLGNMVDGCTALKKIPERGEYYSALCLSLTTKNPNLCLETSENENCQDSYYLYTYYLSKDSLVCDNIKNINVKELCKQINEKSCNNYFGFDGYCSAIITSDKTLCENTDKNKMLLENCNDNFQLYLAFSSMNSGECTDISNVIVSNLCKTLTRG